MWLLGKAGAWASRDGARWSQEKSGEPFNDRRGYGAVVYNDRIWIFGGIYHGNMTNEVWSTADGSEWVREANAPWLPRGAEYSVAFDGKLWIYGGKAGTDYKQADDVWYMTKSKSQGQRALGSYLVSHFASGNTGSISTGTLFSLSSAPFIGGRISA